MDKINFVERFVFVYDTLKDGLGVLYDLYEMFHIEGEKFPISNISISSSQNDTRSVF